MKNKMLRAVCCLVIVFTMAAILVTGCAKGNTSTGSDESSTNAKLTEGTIETTTEKPVEIKTLSLFYEPWWIPTDKWEGIIPEAITAEIGVKLDVTKAVDGQQLPVMIASNDLPDLVWNFTQTKRMSNSSLCYSFDELIPQYCPEWKLEEDRIATVRHLSTDGKYYCLLSSYQNSEMWKSSKISAPLYPSLYYRSDLLEKLGIQVPTNIQELSDMYAKVKEAYPDMVMIGMHQAWHYSCFKTWLGVGVNNVTLSGDKVVYTINHPEYKNTLKYINGLYRKGYMRAENFGTKDDSVIEELIANDKLFSTTHAAANFGAGYENLNKKTNPDAKWTPIGNIGGDKSSLLSTSNGWAGTFITRNCKQPDVAIKFLEFMFSDKGVRLSMWGREGIEYTLDDEGVPTFNEEWKAAQVNTTDLFKKYNPMFYFSSTVITENLSFYPKPEGIVVDIDEQYRNIINVNPAVEMSNPGADTELSVVRSKLDTMLADEEIKIILSKNDEEFENNYANMMNTAEKIGVTKLEAELNKNYEKTKAEFGK